MISSPLTRVAAAAATLLLTSAVFAQLSLVSNDVKYRESGVKAAKGRSGSAEIEARALIGRDNVTVVDVAANGTLDRVQVKLTTAEVTRNFKAEGATFSVSFNDLTRGEPVQVQANVTGADPNRTDVVSAGTTVARRPDLTVASIAAPPHGFAGGPMRIHAVVRELNGDTGARASCVLSVNGMDVDRADNIWVDAGGTVSCTFAPEFASAGDQQYAVRVENVRPGDDDGANNAKSGSLTIYPQAEAFAYWTAQAEEGTVERRYRTESAWFTDHSTQTGWYASSHISASVPGMRVDLPNVRVSVWESTDGEPIDEVLDFPLAYYTRGGGWWDEPEQQCAIGFDDLYYWTEMCQNPANGWFPGAFWIDVFRGAGDVTYRSTGWDKTWQISEPPGYYTWNRDYRDVYGVQKHYGSQVELRLNVSDGNALWEANAVVPLSRQVSEWTQPWTCYQSWMGMSCSEYSNRTDLNQGFAWGR